jgi:hypothetical protein
MKNVTLPFIIITLLCSFAITSFAQDNFKISVQGTLKDPNGLAVDDGSQTITFRLYDAATGGNVVHEETADVQVRGGVYSYLLGSADPVNNPLVPADFDVTLFLSLEISGSELFPRTEMTYSPYSLSVSTAQQATRIASGDKACSGSVGDIKYSILTPAQFEMENGDCWVPMDGRNIPGTKLADNYGWSSVPDMSGLFIRASEFSGGADYDTGRSSSSPVAGYQADQNDSHSHSFSGSTNSAGSHSHSWTLPGDNGTGSSVTGRFHGASSSTQTRTTSSSGSHSHSFSGSTSSSGGSEARPRNRNFYVYIRVD